MLNGSSSHQKSKKYPERVYSYYRPKGYSDNEIETFLSILQCIGDGKITEAKQLADTLDEPAKIKLRKFRTEQKTYQELQETDLEHGIGTTATVAAALTTTEPKLHESSYSYYLERGFSRTQIDTYFPIVLARVENRITDARTLLRAVLQSEGQEGVQRAEQFKKTFIAHQKMLKEEIDIGEEQKRRYEPGSSRGPSRAGVKPEPGSGLI